MKIIFSTGNAIEARLVRDILQQEGIDACISGEYLQGGIGELPVMGLINLMVNEADSHRAEQVIRNWERGDYSIDDSGDDKKTPPDGGAFFA